MCSTRCIVIKFTRCGCKSANPPSAMRVRAREEKIEKRFTDHLGDYRAAELKLFLKFYIEDRCAIAPLRPRRSNLVNDNLRRPVVHSWMQMSRAAVVLSGADGSHRRMNIFQMRCNSELALINLNFTGKRASRFWKRL